MEKSSIWQNILHSCWNRSLIWVWSWCFALSLKQEKFWSGATRWQWSLVLSKILKNGAKMVSFPHFLYYASVHLFGTFLYRTYFSILSNKIRARLVPFFSTVEKKSVKTAKKSVKTHSFTLLIKILKMARKQVRFNLHVSLLQTFLFFHSLLVIYSVLCVEYRALFVECGFFRRTYCS